MKREFYRCKPRLANPETYLEVEKITASKFSVTYHFKSGRTFTEGFTKKELDELKKTKQIVKTPSISWKENEGDTEECQTTTKQKKEKLLEKVKSKKSATAKKTAVKKTAVVAKKKVTRKIPQK
jgi:hypothetical protein